MISFSRICEFADSYEGELDLVVDEIYEGGNHGNINDDVISKLMKVGNAKGIRAKNTLNSRKKAYIVLYTSNEEIDWPDLLYPETGKFKYYGDNKTHGFKIDSKPGNKILESIFNEKNRHNIPPVFIFAKHPTNSSNRSIKFLGLAVPEDINLGKDNSLKAVWRTSNNERFLNYEAHFTILNTKSINRKWLEYLIKDEPLNNQYAPKSWIKYVENGLSEGIILKAPKIIEYRNKTNQLPSNDKDKKKLDIIYNFYKHNPYDFEHFAAKLVRLLDNNYSEFEVTQQRKDGGYDAFGSYTLGHKDHYIRLRCLLEAKCYNYKTDTAVPLKAISRFISRLRHNDIGLFVTTSFISSSTYKEIIDDGHPIIIISGKDIIDILEKNHYNSEESITKFLETIKESIKEHN